MTKMIAISLAIVASAFVYGENADRRFVNTIDRVKHSVVPIICMSGATTEDIKVDWVAGTAFFISESGDFLTAGHVIRALLDEPQKCGIPAIYFPKSGKWPQGVRGDMRWFRFTPGECSLSNKDIDLARCVPVLEIAREKLVPLIVDSVGPPDGTAIAFTGFPLNNPLPVTGRGSISGYGSADDEHVFEMWIDKNAWHGVSGSPVYLENGHVVGVVTATGLADAAGLSFVRTGLAIKAFLSDPDKYK
jgi:V8-like Glu-specific endopeptidase